MPDATNHHILDTAGKTAGKDARLLGLPHHEHGRDTWPDTHLLSACADFEAVGLELKRCNQTLKWDASRSKTLLQRWQFTFEEVVSIRPQTALGLRSKAQAIQAAMASVTSKDWDAEENAAFAFLGEIADVIGTWF
jgi:hypothetical protein